MIRELTGWSRPVGCIACGIGTFLVALTTALGYSLIRFQPFAKRHGMAGFLGFYCV